MVRCSRCNYPLSNERSVAIGMGPVCRRKAGTPFQSGTGGSSSSTSPNYEISSSLPDYSKNMVGSVSVAAIATVEPTVGAAYQGLKAARATKTLYEAHQKGENSEQKSTNLAAAGAEISGSKTARNLSAKRASSFAENLTSSMREEDAFHKASAKVDGDLSSEVMAEMFKASTTSAVKTTSGEAAVFVMEGAM